MLLCTPCPSEHPEYPSPLRPRPLAMCVIRDSQGRPTHRYQPEDDRFWAERLHLYTLNLAGGAITSAIAPGNAHLFELGMDWVARWGGQVLARARAHAHARTHMHAPRHMPLTRTYTLRPTCTRAHRCRALSLAGFRIWTSGIAGWSRSSTPIVTRAAWSRTAESCLNGQVLCPVR